MTASSNTITSHENDAPLAFQLHPDCATYGLNNPLGLHLNFTRPQPEVVETILTIPDRFQGYKGIVHGGIIASLLDAAMAHCLLSQGITAVTGDLNIRYKLPVPIDTSLCLQAIVTETKRQLFSLQAKLWQEQTLLATGTARFVKAPDILANAEAAGLNREQRK